MKAIIDEIISDIGDLPDRASPEGQPDMMLVTSEELEIILERHLKDIRCRFCSDPDLMKDD